MVPRRSAWVLASFVAIGCVGPGPISSSSEDEADAADEVADGSTTSSESESSSESGTSESDDEPHGDPADLDLCCESDLPPGHFYELDLLLVVDGTPTTIDEQAKLAAAMESLFQKLRDMETWAGPSLDVNIMVTSSDRGHPLCVPEPGYEPLLGAPQVLPCTERLADFSSADIDAAALCEDACPVPRAPIDPFIHFANHGATTNVPSNEIAEALACLVPQGIRGCEYGSPLEAMLRALDGGASWNQGDRPFLRPNAMLGIAIVTDTYDCSVRPEGQAYFTDAMLAQHWEIDPESGSKAPSPAICWNSGMECGEPDQDGVYAECTPIDGYVLHPLSRYTNFLADMDRPVFMLDLVGVPIAGGFPELVHRDWIDAPYPAGDLLPGDPSAATLQFEFGIGPACFAEPAPPTGRALPPGRIAEACTQLDLDGQFRCCIESSCEENYLEAIDCLVGITESLVEQ